MGPRRRVVARQTAGCAHTGGEVPRFRRSAPRAPRGGVRSGYSVRDRRIESRGAGIAGRVAPGSFSQDTRAPVFQPGGITPKRFARVHRLQRVLRAVRRSSEPDWCALAAEHGYTDQAHRSEEHTSELQSHSDLVCRLLLEKKKKQKRLMFTDCYTILI